MAFAILAGLPPEYGFYAAMVPPALSALFGSSLHMVAGPTNAVAILLFASLIKDAVYDLLKQGNYLKTIHEDHIFAQSFDPISILYPTLDSEMCRTCSARIFPQCHIELPNGEPRPTADRNACSPVDG